MSALLVSRIGDFGQQFQAAFKLFAVESSSSMGFPSRLELDVREPSMGVVFEGGEADVDDLTKLWASQ